MILFAEKDAVVEVGSLYVELVSVSTPSGGHRDWHVIFSCNVDGHNDDGAVNANIELYVGGEPVPDFKTYVESKLHWVSAQAQAVGSPIGMIVLNYVVKDVPSFTEIEVYGKATGGVSAPFDTGGIDFLVMKLSAVSHQ